MPEIIINEEFAKLLPKQTEEQYTRLRASIIAEGCRDPLVVWKHHDVLLDGHTRLEICDAEGIEYRTVEMEFASATEAKAWVVRNGLARRHMTKDQLDYYRGLQYELEKEQGKRSDLTSGQNDTKSDDTATRLASEHSVSAPTIKRNAAFARAVNAIEEAAGPEAREAILSREVKLSRKEVEAFAALKPASQKKAWAEDKVKDTAKRANAKRSAQKGLPPTIDLKSEGKTLAEELKGDRVVTLEEWNGLTEEDRHELYQWPSDRKFNRQDNGSIEWAQWSWNPVTGCEHGCEYCYARDIANRFYPQGFVSAFHPHRLTCPQNTKVPKGAEKNIGLRNVFVTSMGDLFGSWVPKEWILAVLSRAANAPQWNFLFLTKNPARLTEFEFPKNAAVGTTVDVQARVKPAEKAFAKVEATVKFLSVEPLLEDLTFSHLDYFDWVIIGGGSRSSETSEYRPQREIVNHLHEQARAAGCKIYEKPNLLERITEYPNF